MEYLKKNKKIVVLLFIVLLTIFLLNCFSIMAPDELNYSFVVGTENQRIDSLKDIKQSLTNMYKSWTGRVVVHGLISLFLYVGAFSYNILNPFIFIIFIIMISKIATGKINFYAIASCLFCFLWGTDTFGENFIWLSGSLNYLWPVCGMLLIINWFYKYVVEDEEIEKWQIVLMWCISFFVGWSQENTAFCMGMFFILVAITQLKKFLHFSKAKKINTVVTIVLFGIGAILLIFAPGNFARMKTSTGGINISFALIIQNLKAIKKIIILYLLSLILAIVLNKKTSSSIIQVLKKQFVYFLIPAGVALMPMAVIPEFSVRAILPYTVFIVIALIINLAYIQKAGKEIQKVTEVLGIVLSLISVYILSYNAFLAYKYVEPIKKEIAFQIAMAKHDGEENVIVPEFVYYHKIQRDGIVLGFFPETIDNAMNNYYMSRYYGVKTIEAVPDGYVIIEADLSDETEAVEYNVIDRETGVAVGKRIIRAANPVGSDMIGRIIYKIPKEKIGQYVIEIPEELKTKVTKCVIKDLSGIKPIEMTQVIK